jgi:AcrR family transcriptional regulator
VSGENTRQELIGAAERLFASRGIEGPSLREITREAGQRNTGALQYHFGDREGLLKAVISKHEPGVDTILRGLLDQQELIGSPNLGGLAAALVLPYIPKLDDLDGADYLQIRNELLHRPGLFRSVLYPTHRESSLHRWSRLLEPLLEPEAVGRPLHRRFAAIRFAAGELASRARESRGHDHRLFTSQLVDLVAGILAAPVSESTRALIRPSLKDTGVR